MSTTEEPDLIAEAKAAAEQDPVVPATSGEASQVAVTDEEKTQVIALAQELIKDNVEFRQVVGTMVASRQLYAMAVRELELLVGDLPEDKQHELLEECLIQSAGHQAAKQFEENDLYVGFQETVYPWMLRVVDKHNRLEKTQRQQDAEAWESARRLRPLPLGIEYDPEFKDCLPRDRALVLVGWGPVVRYVLDKMVTAVLAARHPEQVFYAIRLHTHAPTNTKGSVHRLSPDVWDNCTASNTSWPLLFQKHLLPLLDAPIDLLVCDDLRHAAPKLSGTKATATRGGNHAHKKLRDWCKKVGAGMLFGIQLDDRDPPDLAKPEWEQLRAYATLRPVWISDKDEDSLDVSVMLGRNTLVEKVPRGFLSDIVKGKQIITE